MNMTMNPIETLPAPDTALSVQRTRRTRRPAWPIFGAVAGIAGFVSASAALGSQKYEDEDIAKGVDIIDDLQRGGYHIAFVTGLIAVFALFVAATGWRRWAEQRAPRDLAARTIGTALAATATVNIIFTCLAGSMALYLKGGVDEGHLSKQAMFVNYSLLDFGSLLGWWGGFVAAGCVAVLALRKHRVLPRWMGIVSVVLMLPAIGLAVGTALPGFVGLTMTLWLVIISVGLVFSRTAEA